MRSMSKIFIAILQHLLQFRFEYLQGCTRKVEQDLPWRLHWVWGYKSENDHYGVCFTTTRVSEWWICCWMPPVSLQKDLIVTQQVHKFHFETTSHRFRLKNEALGWGKSFRKEKQIRCQIAREQRSGFLLFGKSRWTRVWGNLVEGVSTQLRQLGGDTSSVSEGEKKEAQFLILYLWHFTKKSLKVAGSWKPSRCEGLEFHAKALGRGGECWEVTYHIDFCPDLWHLVVSSTAVSFQILICICVSYAYMVLFHLPRQRQWVLHDERWNQKPWLSETLLSFSPTHFVSLSPNFASPFGYFDIHRHKKLRC